MGQEGAATLQRSVDNSDLVHKRLSIKPRVKQYELAAELGVAAPVLSEFETGRRERLPDGRGRSEYLEALERIEARRAEARRVVGEAEVGS